MSAFAPRAFPRAAELAAARRAALLQPAGIERARARLAGALAEVLGEQASCPHARVRALYRPLSQRLALEGVMTRLAGGTLVSTTRPRAAEDAAHGEELLAAAEASRLDAAARAIRALTAGPHLMAPDAPKRDVRLFGAVVCVARWGQLIQIERTSRAMIKMTRPAVAAALENCEKVITALERRR